MVNKLRIPLGIGDILITRMIFDQYKLHRSDVHLVINLNIIKTYRANSTEYTTFIYQLLNLLFPYTNIEHVTDDIVPASLIYTYPLSKVNINVWSRLPSCLSRFRSMPYIIFHTKCRFDGHAQWMQAEGLSQIEQILAELIIPTHWKICILGEREPAINAENKIHGTITIYQNVLRSLKHRTNDIIDLTSHECGNTPNMGNFIRDACIIKNGFNVLVGLGGNMVLTTAVTDNYVLFVYKIEHVYLKSLNEDLVTRNIQQFKHKLQTKLLNTK